VIDVTKFRPKTVYVASPEAVLERAALEARRR
jgi:hypothetical protein